MSSRERGSRCAPICALVVFFGCVGSLDRSAKAGLASTLNIAGAPDPGHSYELVIDPNADWAQANGDAAKLGGWLVTIDSLAEQEFVQDLLLTQKAPAGAYWFGLVKSPATGKYGWSSNTHKPAFLHWAPKEPDNNGGNEAYGSIFWNGPTGPTSLRSLNGFWNDLPLHGYRKGAPQVTSDLVEAGYIVEFIGRHRGAVPAVAVNASTATASSGSGATVSSVPLPPAVLLFPLMLFIAAYASRRRGGVRG